MERGLEDAREVRFLSHPPSSRESASEWLQLTTGGDETEKWHGNDRHDPIRGNG